MEGVIHTVAGDLRGTLEGGVWVFRGVPFAEVSGPDARWRPPAAPPSWSGVREATAWGPIAPQTPPVPGFSLPEDPTASDENCLSLNVWTQRLDGARPVFVWLHGGGFTTGTGASALFAGRHLAAQGAGGGDAQLPPRCTRPPGAPRPVRRERRVGELVPARPDRRAAMGGGQHRRLRGRPGERDPGGRVGGGHEHLRLLGAPGRRGCSTVPSSRAVHRSTRRRTGPCGAPSELARPSSTWTRAPWANSGTCPGSDWSTATQRLATEAPPPKAASPSPFCPWSTGASSPNRPATPSPMAAARPCPCSSAAPATSAALFTVGESAPGAVVGGARRAPGRARSSVRAPRDVVDAYRQARQTPGRRRHAARPVDSGDDRLRLPHPVAHDGHRPRHVPARRPSRISSRGSPRSWTGGSGRATASTSPSSSAPSSTPDRRVRRRDRGRRGPVGADAGGLGCLRRLGGPGLRCRWGPGPHIDRGAEAHHGPRPGDDSRGGPPGGPSASYGSRWGTVCGSAIITSDPRFRVSDRPPTRQNGVVGGECVEVRPSRPGATVTQRESGPATPSDPDASWPRPASLPPAWPPGRVPPGRGGAARSRRRALRARRRRRRPRGLHRDPRRQRGAHHRRTSWRGAARAWTTPASGARS